MWVHCLIIPIYYSYLQSVTKYLRLTLVFMRIGHHGKSLIAIFRDVFASTSKIFIFAGELDTRQFKHSMKFNHSMKFKHFPNIS